MSIKNKKKLVLLVLIFCCCFIAAGYFVLMRQMTVQGHIRLEEPQWEVKFTNITTTKIVGDAGNYRIPQLSDYLINFYATFKQPGDSIEYDVTVSNRGTLDAKLIDIDFETELDKVIDFEVSELRTGYILANGKHKTFKLKVTYTGNGSQIVDDKESMKLILRWEQT